MGPSRSILPPLSASRGSNGLPVPILSCSGSGSAASGALLGCWAGGGGGGCAGSLGAGGAGVGGDGDGVGAAAGPELPISRPPDDDDVDVDDGSADENDEGVGGGVDVGRRMVVNCPNVAVVDGCAALDGGSSSPPPPPAAAGHSTPRRLPTSAWPSSVLAPMSTLPQTVPSMPWTRLTPATHSGEHLLGWVKSKAVQPGSWAL